MKPIETLQELYEMHLPNYSGDDRIALLDDTHKWFDGELTDDEIEEKGFDQQGQDEIFNEYVRLSDLLFAEALKEYEDLLIKRQTIYVTFDSVEIDNVQRGLLYVMKGILQDFVNTRQRYAKTSPSIVVSYSESTKCFNYTCKDVPYSFGSHVVKTALSIFPSIEITHTTKETACEITVPKSTLVETVSYMYLKA